MRRRLAPVRKKKVGAAPGTLVHIGEKKGEKARITLISYGPERLEEGALRSPSEARETGAGGVSWLNLDGLHDVPLIEAFGKKYGLHPLVLEDILNTGGRPKLEDYGDYLFLVAKMLFHDEEAGEIRTEQVSFVLGSGYVLSFQEEAGDVFNGVRERLRSGKGRIRRMGPDYLAYALLDAIVDSYFVILEKIGDQLERMEDELIVEATPESLQKIHAFKREMILLRKSVWPLREVLAALQRDETPLVTEATGVFLRDVYDHTIQVVDTVETFRDLIGGLLDLYLSSISNRMNEVMKVLTIIATIFIPLTFLAGIYGMNFEHIPELKWRWGYAAFWLAVVVLGGAMFGFFRRKKWL
ncbi:MAG: magnesium and cobalt transport protein CorA [Desulfuromonas sp.]|uniref:magnesium/cobalt transporter CorA n=1 Tax=Desulfuromonas sp. TaxID=892 RepID=UPI000CC65812|nr:magnesium/cobalt transporter CorA [Desulfuromonas sp.]PLX86607.1 MAG: magnesium and cobalt transport protein CorA [Desulfuromonas sp.]